MARAKGGGGSLTGHLHGGKYVRVLWVARGRVGEIAGMGGEMTQFDCTLQMGGDGFNSKCSDIKGPSCPENPEISFMYGNIKLS